MYKRTSKGWLKHLDFIVLDLICLQLAFIIAYLLRYGFVNIYANSLYRNMSVFLVFADMVVMFLNETFHNVLKRGYYKEFIATIKQTIFVWLFTVLYLFTTKESAAYSRLVLYVLWFLYLLLSYSVRIAWKFFLKNNIPKDSRRSMLIVTSKEIARTVIENVRNENYSGYLIVGVAVIDEDLTDTMISGEPVVANRATVIDFICHHWVDEVFVDVDSEDSDIQSLISDIAEAGVTVHIKLAKLSEAIGKKQLIEKIGNYSVLTTSINYMTQKQAAAKRMLDIIGGFVGCLLTAVICVFVAPVIYISSPGPIFFSQVRVGKNGKKFKIYKFRSMYMDAEGRKKELMEQNRMKDGMMFKMDFDPRIIGNKVLPSGKKKTGIGDFIRRTSLDEFPQFFNVLRGDMSLVGTRPPTVDEWEKYELHHRARLAAKPGITGMWQVSGRSKITDFEEVVKLDTKYINEWSMGMDLRILLKTVLIVLKGEGSM